MKNIPFWLDIPYTPRRSLSENSKTDVVILGGGITGVSAAYHCAKAGFNTVLIEKDVIASGSAGRNAGMVVDGLAIDFFEAAEQFGLETARELWMKTVEARKLATSLVKDEHINCDLEQVGSLYIGFTEEDAKKLKTEAAARKKENISCEIIEKGTQFALSPFGSMLYNPEDCAIHPVKFVRGLALAAEKYGAKIYENTEALKFDAHEVTAPQGKITADKVILALESTDPYISKNGSATKIIRSQAIVTEPLSEGKMAELDWKCGGMLWTADGDYISCRRVGDRLLTCKTLPVNPTEEEKEKNKEWQINKLLSFFPSLHKNDLTVSHQWSGLMVETESNRPYIEEHAGCYRVCGHGGNGLTNGTISGKIISEYIAGKPIPRIYKEKK